MTLPQALFYARRAEALARAWRVGEGAAAEGGGEAARAERAALAAATGPVVAVLRACGCGGAGARL